MLKKIIHTSMCLLVSAIVTDCLLAQEPSVYKVTRMPFNSGVFNDISPVIVQDGILFCSDRRFSSVVDRTTFEGRRLYNIYMAERTDTAEWGKAKEVKSERSYLFNNGPLCVAPDGKTVYFTSEIETGKITRKRKFVNYSGIFIAELNGTELISLRPFPFNSMQYNIGQPSVSRDGKYLFFSSDMPGGQGGSDLYYCELIDGQWSAPVNMGPRVNSPGRENFPYMHPSGRLYFSSDRPGGPGRLDVYYSTLTFGSWEDPILLPEPINSTDDDFAFVADQTLETGFFSSNRQRSDDIYMFASTIIRKASCDTLIENNYCYQLIEENAIRYDSIPFRYEWSLGDGTKATGNVVEHCFPGPGSYLVQLDVVNLITNEVMTNEKTYSLEITDAEQPYINGPDEVIAGQDIRFDANNTNLPGWNIARYYWNFGDETIAVGKEVDKIYLTPGTYNIQLIVTAEPDPGGIIRETCVCKNIVVKR
ncbi:MAG: PKD domain-containing protein [Bacteroidales bacterium]|nr:PKD domain-containing protein [Bacteroidales bacterium]